MSIVSSLTSELIGITEKYVFFHAQPSKIHVLSISVSFESNLAELWVAGRQQKN